MGFSTFIIRETLILSLQYFPLLYYIISINFPPKEGPTMTINEETINALEVDEKLILSRISEKLSISLKQVNATVTLIREGNTVPFISRYRKEVTGSLDEVQVRDISRQLVSQENLEGRRIEIIKTIFGQEKLTPELLTNIEKCKTLTELESLYAPYKQKKKTRAMLAEEKGLAPLAEFMLELGTEDVKAKAAAFINAEKGVEDIDQALQGAMDIIAERASQDMDSRTVIKKKLMKEAFMTVTGSKDAETSVYKMYYDFREPISKIKPHRILAINRGEKEKELKSKIEFEYDGMLSQFEGRFEINNDFQEEAIADGLKRLLLPSLEREIRSEFNEQADLHGIGVFSKNLKDLLLSPPIKGTRVMGIDPGIRTGTKIVMLDETGKFLDNFMIYQKKAEEAAKLIAENVQKHKVELIAIGDGTGSHDVQQVVAKVITDNNLEVQYTVVSEDGASVYSASDIAREEFPKLDLTVRGAISIGRRLQDPLAELVKIDPQSIGVGLYQHDLNQKALGESLDEVVESVVNNVGVNLNTASFSLLKYVSGVSGKLAKNIVSYRDEHGGIKQRDALKDVSGMGPKSYENCAGFLKIIGGEDELDNTWVHPENYPIAREIKTAIASGSEPDKAAKEALMKEYNVGITTIDDIILELKKPNRDPRDGYPKPIMQKGVVEFSDLKTGMKVQGKVKNVVDFGAFVDLGIKETALVHISELSDSYVSHPMDVIKVGDVKEYTIIEIDEARKRIALSLKTPGAAKAKQEQKAAAKKDHSGKGNKPGNRNSSGKNQNSGKPRQSNNRGSNRSSGSQSEGYNPFKGMLG